jgi:hypothetical protein
MEIFPAIESAPDSIDQFDLSNSAFQIPARWTITLADISLKNKSTVSVLPSLLNGNQDDEGQSSIAHPLSVMRMVMMGWFVRVLWWRV